MISLSVIVGTNTNAGHNCDFFISSFACHLFGACKELFSIRAVLTIRTFAFFTKRHHASVNMKLANESRTVEFLAEHASRESQADKANKSIACNG